MKTPQVHWKNYPASALLLDRHLTTDWDQLNAARSNLPFMTSEAISCALDILGDGRERLLVAYEQTRVVAMFVLAPQGSTRWQTFQPSQMPLGAWVADPSASLHDLAHSLMRGPLGACLVLSITQVDPAMAARQADTPDSHYADYIDTGWIDIDGDFDTYWAARGKNLRQNMRKQRTRLRAEGVNLTLQVLRDPADMAPALARYGRMESTGWKAQSGTAIHPDNVQGRFYRRLLEQASLRDEAVIYQYLFDDRVVAMNLCLVREGTLVVLKTTYDESIAGYSPAFLLRESELKEIFEQHKIRRIEYFGRLMEWHTRLTDHKRTLYHLTLYRWPFIKTMAEMRRGIAKESCGNAATPT